MNRKILHTPDGVRDLYGEECRRKRQLELKLHDVLNSFGYQDIETPTFEYFDVFGRETGTIPYYQAVANDFTAIIRPEWLNRSGILKEESDTGSAYYVFNDHAVLDVAPEYVGYREYTDEQFDYNWRAREVDDPNLEPDWGDKQAFSYNIEKAADLSVL